MANAVAWFMFLLGIAHIVFGLVRFKGPVLDTVSAGFIGKFAAAVIAFVVALAHSVLGGRHVRIIWAAWHIVTVFALCLGAVLLRKALLDRPAGHRRLHVAGSAMAVTPLSHSDWHLRVRYGSDTKARNGY